MINLLKSVAHSEKGYPIGRNPRLRKLEILEKTNERSYNRAKRSESTGMNSGWNSVKIKLLGYILWTGGNVVVLRLNGRKKYWSVWWQISKSFCLLRKHRDEVLVKFVKDEAPGKYSANRWNMLMILRQKGGDQSDDNFPLRQRRYSREKAWMTGELKNIAKTPK